jgi:hypothetical protein
MTIIKNNNNKKLKFINSIILGVKHGYKINTLPNNILELHNNIFIRIFRIIGGISILLVISRKIIDYNQYIFILVTCIGILFIFYQFYIYYHKTKYIIKLFKEGKLDIRNSPINRIASIMSKIIICVKGGCDVAASIGSLGALGIIGDEILKESGIEPIFIP